MDGKYFKKIVGQKCYLSPISLEDADYFTEWFNDFSVTLNLNAISDIITLEKENEILQRLSTGYVFAIIENEKKKVIGSTGFHSVDLTNGNAQFGIFIGDKNFWNRGYGTDATTLMLDFGFNILNLHHIYLHVLEFNKRGIKCYEKAGFKTVGKLSEYRQICGERFDMLIMEILAKDFQSVFIKKTLEDAKQGKTGMDLKLV